MSEIKTCGCCDDATKNQVIGGMKEAEIITKARNIVAEGYEQDYRAPILADFIRRSAMGDPTKHFSASVLYTIYRLHKAGMLCDRESPTSLG
jgi:hypothetical protein